MTIAGDYRTKRKELDIVKQHLDRLNIPYLRVEKCQSANDADVIVWLTQTKKITIEVKEEDYSRIQRFNDLGIDYISSCVLKDDRKQYKWKGAPKLPSRNAEFESELDFNSPNFKLGKLYYSKADIWLFFCKKGEQLEFLELYDGSKIVTPEFQTHVRRTCKFVMNSKNENQLSHSDLHHSAVFFLPRTDQVMKSFLIDLKAYVSNVLGESNEG